MFGYAVVTSTLIHNEMKRLSRTDLDHIISHWDRIDPSAGVYTFPRKPWYLKWHGGGDDTALLDLAYSGILRKLTPEKIRDIAVKVRDNPTKDAPVNELDKNLNDDDSGNNSGEYNVFS